jgi:Helix-turn-helix of DDE superfamily endonuclease
MEDKLLFILYYVKVYPLQELLAFEFGISQSTAHEWIHLLSGVLKRALDFGGHLPQRDPKQLHRVLQEESEAEYGIDGTERRRQRPVDEEQQKLYYSGKKKRIRSKML